MLRSSQVATMIPLFSAAPSWRNCTLRTIRGHLAIAMIVLLPFFMQGVQGTFFDGPASGCRVSSPGQGYYSSTFYLNSWTDIKAPYGASHYLLQFSGVGLSDVMSLQDNTGSIRTYAAGVPCQDYAPRGYDLTSVWVSNSTKQFNLAASGKCRMRNGNTNPNYLVLLAAWC